MKNEEILLRKILEQLQILNQTVNSIAKKQLDNLEESRKKNKRNANIQQLNETQSTKRQKNDTHSVIETILKQPLDNIMRKVNEK